jgi:glycosyltransferase involved in cell wall biosynthesis
MRIGIDARFFGPSGTGPGRYVQRLVQHLAMLPSPHTYVLFLQGDAAKTFTPPDARFETRVADFRWYSVTEQLFLPRILAQANLDLMHFPHFNVPLLYRGPFVVTIHDLIITHFATRRATTLGPLTYAIKQAGYRQVITKAAKRAKRVLTVSKYSKRELVETFHLPPDRVVVTYEGADHAHRLSVPKAQGVLRAFGITKPYLLYVGNTYPHKNLERFLHGYRRYRRERPDAFDLVLVGKRDYFSRRLEREVEHLGLSGNVRFTGYVQDDELPALYQNAEWYVFPSLYEGFGLPPLEAMSYGLPVLSSNATCLPEILGDAAVYFSPHTSASITLKHAHDRDRQTALRTQGRAWVQRYSWEWMARKTLDVYEAVLRSLPSRHPRG